MGCFQKVGVSLSLQAGDPLELHCRGKEGACVPGEEGEGCLRCVVEEVLRQPERVPGQQFTSILVRVN